MARTEFKDRSPGSQVAIVAAGAVAAAGGWFLGQLLPVPALGPGAVIALILVLLVVERLRKKS